MAGNRGSSSSDGLFESLDDLIRKHPSEGEIYRVSMSMGKKLHEKKVHLLENVVRVAGLEIARKVLRLTLDQEKKGGCLTAKGTRRTPGGAYLTMLKDHVSAAQYKEIYKDDRRWKSKVRQVRRREQKRKFEEKQQSEQDQDDKENCTLRNPAPKSDCNPRFQSAMLDSSDDEL